MGSPRTIYLHIGKHKTGSSSIQKFLKRAQYHLGEKGYKIISDLEVFPGGGLGETSRFNCFHIAHVLLRPGLRTPARLRGRVPILPDPVAVARQVNAFLDAQIESRAILSAEALSFLRSPEEQELYRIMFRGFQIVPIGFFRQPADWLRSWYAQIEKMGLEYHPDAAARQGIFDFSATSWLVQDENIRAFFGTDGIYSSYERAIATYRSVLPAFLEALEIDPEADFEMEHIWENPTIGSGSAVKR